MWGEAILELEAWTASGVVSAQVGILLQVWHPTSMYDPLNSGFGDSSAPDTLNPQWNSPPNTPKQLVVGPGGGQTTPGVETSPPIQSVTRQPVKGWFSSNFSCLAFIFIASWYLLGPFGREPQIYGQPEPGLISPATNRASNGQSFEKSEPYLRVRITSLDRNRRDILIKFDAQVGFYICASSSTQFASGVRLPTYVIWIAQTNLSNFTGQTYRNISRSYYEFQQFADQIVYSNPQTIVQALPLSQTSAPSDDEGTVHSWKSCNLPSHHVVA